MLETIITAIIAFTSTNIDDLFILMILFTQTSATFKRSNIFAGQYLGITTLITISFIGSFVKFFISPVYIGFLGLIPVSLGIIKLYNLMRTGQSEEEDKIEVKNNEEKSWFTLFSVQTLSVASITIANGGDNIGIYVPLFAALTLQALIITISIFMIMVYCWLKISEFLASHPALEKMIKQYSYLVFPVVLICLGIYIMFKSGTIGLVTALLQRQIKHNTIAWRIPLINKPEPFV